MAETAAELVVDVTAKESVSAVLARLESQLDKTNSSVEQIATGLATRLGASQQKAAQSALAHAQAEARLQAASGDAAAGIRTLQTALDGVDRSSTAAIRAETQLVQMQTRLAKETQGTNQFVDAFKQGLFGFAAPVAVANTALSVLQSTAQSFVDAFNFKTKLDQSQASIKVLLNGVRDSGTVFAGAQRFAAEYKLTQEETTDAIQASIPVIRGSKASIEEVLGVFARLKVLKPEKTFGDAARALGELQAGQIVSIVDQFNLSRTAANKMKDEIAKGADAVQVLSKYLTDSGVGMDALAVQTQGAAGAVRDLAKAQEDLKLAQAGFAQGPGLTILQGQIAVTTGATRILSGNFEDARRSIANAADAGSFGFQLFDTIMGGTLSHIATYQKAADQAAASQAQIGDTASASAAALAAFDAEMARSGDTTQAEAAYQATLANALAQSAQAANAATGPMDAAAAGQLAQAAAAQQATAANQAAAESVLAMVAASTENAQASVLATAQNAAQQAAVKQLTEETNKEVGAFLAMNPLIDAAGIAALVAAGKIPALIGQLAALRVEAYSTRDAVAALAAAQGLNVKSNLGPGGLGIGAPGITSGKNNSVDAVVALQTANKKAADDQIAGDLAIAKAKGNTAGQISLLRQQQQGLNKDSLQYKQIEADIIGIEKGKKGGGAGGTKLSDQQKLNNQLQAGQDAADNKSEDAEKQHQQRILDIEADFARKQREQLAANEVSKRQSQADFYDRLTSSELNKKKGGSVALKQIDADYQAAYQKSQELAQSGNAKLASDYLALKQKQADQELAYQEALAKAGAEKDKAEISRLQAIHKLRADANAEEEKQLLAGGDANVNAKDQALADESDKYATSQDKIALASERSADRQIAAAARTGKKIDETQLKIDKLGTSYDRIAPGAGQATANGTPAATAPAASDAAAPAATAPKDPAAALDEAKAAIVDAIDKATSAIKSVESAVRSSSGRFAS